MTPTRGRNAATSSRPRSKRTSTTCAGSATAIRGDRLLPRVVDAVKDGDVRSATDERELSRVVTRMGHMGLRVPDLDAAVDFQREVVGMVETERAAGAAYLSCNDRHHELILIQDPVRRGYDHIGLEVPDAQALEAARSRVRRGRRPPARRRLRRRARDRPRAPGPGAGGPRLQALLRHGDWPDARRRRPARSSSSTPRSRSATRALSSASSPRGWDSSSATAWASSPAGGTATPTTMAWPWCWRRSRNSRTTPTPIQTSMRWAGLPTGSSGCATRG